MKRTNQFRLRQFFFGLLVAATASVDPADAAGLGLFSHSDLAGGCSADACDAGCDAACGDPFACCDGVGCDGCDTCSLGGDLLGNGFLGGLIKPSDRCFDDFVSPMINFVHFEDPRTLTEFRPIFVNHWVPNTIGNGVPAGGTIQAFATQFRIALTERLSLIGVKDGYIWDNTNGTLDTLLDDGWAAVTAGLKYNLLRDAQSGTLASIGGTYEIPMGSDEALQNVGDGEFHLFVTGGQRLFGGNAHLLSSFGWRTPVDSAVQSESIHWSSQFDVRLTNSIYLLTGLEWWHWTDSASNGLPLGVAGQDLFNLSASDVTGNDLVSQNVGMKFKPSRAAEYGIAYQFPLSEFKDVLEHRLQVEMIYRY